MTSILTHAGKKDIARMQDWFCSLTYFKSLDYVVGAQMFIELTYIVTGYRLSRKPLGHMQQMLQILLNILQRQ